MSGPGHFAPQVVRGGPDAEAARLAEERKAPVAPDYAEPEWTPEQLAEFRAAMNEALKSGAFRSHILPSHADTLCHSFVQVPPEFDVPDEHRAGIEISVTATQSYPVTADLASRIREVIWESMRAAKSDG